jgi:hypothetical protein
MHLNSSLRNTCCFESSLLRTQSWNKSCSSYLLPTWQCVVGPRTHACTQLPVSCPLSEVLIKCGSSHRFLCQQRYNENRQHNYFFPMVQQPLDSQGLLIIELSLSHSDTTHSSGPLWTSDQPDEETTTYTTHNRRTPMTSVGFELTIPASKRLQADALERTATGIGCYMHTTMYIVSMIIHFGSAFLIKTICNIPS